MSRAFGGALFGREGTLLKKNCEVGVGRLIEWKRAGGLIRVTVGFCKLVERYCFISLASSGGLALESLECSSEWQSSIKMDGSTILD